MLLRVWRHEDGQDLIEYTLLLAFVALAAAGLTIQTGGGAAAIWNAANNLLTSANRSAS